MEKHNFLLLITLLYIGCDSIGTKDTLHMNHIQTIGSHNSYKQAIQPELLDILLERDSNVMTLSYEHLPLTEQLDLGLRKIEIDIYHDPDGARYSSPGGNKILEQQEIDVLPFPGQELLKEAGFKVFHVQDVDFRSHCILLKDCLLTVKSWSDIHPEHLPIVITINVKTEPLKDPESTQPLPFTSEVYDSLDLAFIKGLGRDKIITPEDVMRKHKTLNDAITTSGWPSLKLSRGKFLIILDEPLTKINTYIERENWKNAILFVNAPPGHPHSAFVISNNPIEQEEHIKSLVLEGYIVRTRADADTNEARNNDYNRFEAAKRSGAQYISTDYYYRTKDFPEFLIQFENGKYERCNPVILMSECKL